MTDELAPKVILSPFEFSECKNATQALFYEHRDKAGKVEPVFTKHGADRLIGGKRYYSLRRLYVDSMDPTGWTFVKRVFQGDWEHWERVKSALNGYILTNSHTDDWNAEMELVMKSTAFRQIIKDAQDSDSQSRVSTCKWIVEEKWKVKPNGRSEEKKKKADIENKNLINSVKDDANRVAHLFELKG